MTPPPSTQLNSPADTAEKATPTRCFVGALIAAGIATPLYVLTMAIAQTFASKPLLSDNTTAMKISVAVRTLVVGLSTLATGIFAIAALGLVALGIQLWIQQLRQPKG